MFSRKQKNFIGLFLILLAVYNFFVEASVFTGFVVSAPSELVSLVLAGVGVFFAFYS